MIWIDFFDEKENKIKNIKDSNKIKVIRFDFMVDCHADQMYIYLEEKRLSSLTKPSIKINYKHLKINNISATMFIEKAITELEYEPDGFFLDDSITLRINQGHDIKIEI
jgi:hypothetical protein